MNQTWTRLFLVALILGLVACSQAPTLKPTVVREQTKVLDAAVLESLSEVREDGTLVFNSSTTTNQLKQGDVLVGAPSTLAPNGLLRKVDAVSQSSGKVTLQTSQAQLGDALQKGSLRVEQELTPDDVRSSLPAEGVSISAVTAQATSIGFTFKKAIVDTDGNENTKDDRIEVSGEISIKPKIKIDLDLDCGFLCLSDNDIDFLAQIGVEQTAKIKIEGKGIFGVNIKKTIPLATYNFGPKTFFIGPVPVVITPRIVLELKFDGTAGLKISYEASQTLKVVAGAKYDDSWKNISSISNDFSVGPVEAEATFSAQLSAKAKAALRGELMFYGIVGPTIEIAPYVKFDLVYPRDPFWKLDGGLEANVGININVLGYSKSYSTNLLDNSIEIARSQNSAPSISFASPGTADVDINRCCTLSVNVSDPEDGNACCAVSFRSSNSADGVAGALGNASGSRPELAYTFTTLGTRTITASAVDSKGKLSSTTLRFTVVNTPPTVSISSPFSGQQFFRGVSYTLRAVSFDRNETDFQLPCSGLTWNSSVGGDGFPRSGCELRLSFPSNGPRTLTLRGLDSHGGNASVTTTITVVDPPANLPPVVNLTQPRNNLEVGPDTVIQLAGNATDPEGGAVTLEWDVTSGYNPQTGAGNQTFSVTPGAGGNWKPTDSIPYNASGGCEISDTLRLRLRARDPQNNESFDFIVIRVSRIC